MTEYVEAKMLEWITELGDERTTALYQQIPFGKRLRAKLILMIAGNSEEATQLAAVVEMVHAASLLHDDVIDDAMTRRGVESVNATDGSKTSIMLGDILYSKAFYELTKFDQKIAGSISNAVTQLSIGELLDVKMADAFNDDEEAYLNMIYKKTASLIEAACESAAMLVGKDAAAFATYGKALGLAFQIIDDILDITQDEETLGKPALNDFVEGKCTLPYIYLYHKLNGSDQERLVSMHLKALKSDEQTWIKTQMDTHQTVAQSYELAKEHSSIAIEAIKGEMALEAIVMKLMDREY
jgi:octaprenyl-diphosphate synthase